MNEERGHQYLKTHQLRGEVLYLDLPEEQRQILEKAKSSSNGTTAKTLIKDGPLRVVMIGLQQGASLREHKAEGPVAIQALQGSARISSGDESKDLAAGGLEVFGAGVTHSVEAQSDSVILLTIAMAEA